jgi:hypothetical protein
MNWERGKEERTGNFCGKASGGHKIKREDNIKLDLTKQTARAGSEYRAAVSIWYK